MKIKAKVDEQGQEIDGIKTDFSNVDVDEIGETPVTVSYDNSHVVGIADSFELNDDGELWCEIRLEEGLGVAASRELKLGTELVGNRDGDWLIVDDVTGVSFVLNHADPEFDSEIQRID